MIVLFDTNLLADVTLKREPFQRAASLLFSFVDRGRITGLAAATSITTLYYIVEKNDGAETAGEAVRKVLNLFNIAPVSRAVLEDALALHFRDYEDAVIHEAARHAGAEAIITRDATGFKTSTLPVHTPDDFLKMLSPA